MFEVKMNVSTKEWMSHPEQRWNAGLDRAGFNFRQGLQRSHEPPIPPGSRYKRTHQTADRASYNITEPGRVMEFGSTFYLPFILFGTRFWGGWPGKADELQGLMSQGFKSGIKDYTEG